MTRRQENKLTMYNAVLKVLLSHQNDWQNIPLINTKVNELSTRIKEIREALQIQEKVYKGKTMDKKNLRELLGQKAASMAKIIAAYATINNNMALKEEVNYSQTDINRVADNITIERIDIIIAAAYDNADEISALGPFPVTDINELDLIADDYADRTSVTREAIIIKKSATTNLRVIFKNTSDMLKDVLDGAMEFLNEKPVYEQYHNARIIVDYRGSRRNNSTPPANTDE